MCFVRPQSPWPLTSGQQIEGLTSPSVWKLQRRNEGSVSLCQWRSNTAASSSFTDSLHWMSLEIKHKMSNSWKVVVVLSVLANFSHTSTQNTASVPGGESQAAPAVYWQWLCDMILSNVSIAFHYCVVVVTALDNLNRKKNHQIERIKLPVMVEHFQIYRQKHVTKPPKFPTLWWVSSRLFWKELFVARWMKWHAGAALRQCCLVQC